MAKNIIYCCLSFMVFCFTNCGNTDNKPTTTNNINNTNISADSAIVTTTTHAADTQIIPYVIPKTTTNTQNPPKQSTTNNQQPTISNQQPTISNQQPITSNQQPTTNNQQPTISNQQPTISNQQSTTNNQQPIINNSPPQGKPMRPSLSHHLWEELLQKYVNENGKVNYAGLKTEKAKLDEYLTHLMEFSPAADWSKNKEIAYWINLYNAFTIKLVLDKYPINSILDLSGGKVWTTEKINIGDKNYTLDNIEKDMLLRKFKEPRVHFAVNCAAASCPPLLNHAFTEGNVLVFLEQQTKAFINNTTFNNLSAKPVELSQIFNWYADDFGGAANVLSYINQYATKPTKTDAKVKFMEYNWQLNK